MDKLAIAEYKASDTGATRASSRFSAATAPREPMAPASSIGLSMRLWERDSPDTEPKAETAANYEAVAMSSQAEPNYISKARSWIWSRATLGSCRKALATATKSPERSQRWKPSPRLRKCTAGTKASQPAEPRRSGHVTAGSPDATNQRESMGRRSSSLSTNSE